MVFWPLAAVSGRQIMSCRPRRSYKFLQVIGRYLRNVHPKWNRMHCEYCAAVLPLGVAVLTLTILAADIVSGVISAPVLIVVFALGRAHKIGTFEPRPSFPDCRSATDVMGDIGDPDNWTTFHFRNGLALLLLGLLQAIYGTILHRFTSRFPVTGPKAMLRYLHPITGVSRPHRVYNFLGHSADILKPDRDSRTRFCPGLHRFRSMG